ncbi:MAG: hypothetical protein R3272_11200, partial [Candidatus Promineifilaceae bacterium]|nr:hypothetical protein [Candidatus Promineifilaceae bacterium]
WRYLDAPYRSELSFYAVGRDEAPSHYLIARYKEDEGQTAVRILDLWGDLNDQQAVRALIRRAVGDAASRGAVQVTVMITLPMLSAQFRSLGFLIPAKARFCWLSRSDSIMARLGGTVYWTLGDSDADAPE